MASSAFSRQHYDQIAAIILKVRKSTSHFTHPEIAINRIAEQLAQMFYDDNSRFDVGYFLNKTEK
jgi:hypothetical protein